MKLYTEEQMAKVWMAGQKYWETSGASITFEELLEREKLIKLPSDEEIENSSYKMSGNNVSPSSNFMIGAYWMKEQILGKEDKTFKQKSKWTEVDNMTRRLK